MCGRYQVSTEEEIMEMREILSEINERYKNKTELTVMKTGEIFPTEVAPVLVSGNTQPQAALMKWGFPQWKGNGVIINARAETVTEKPTFRSSMLYRRCVVPTTGFYEWQKHEGTKNKTKYLFRLPDTKMVYLAGIYQTNPQGTSYAIVTTAANPFMSWCHDRMPLILDSAALGDWLKSTDYALNLAHTPCAAELLAEAV